MIEQLPTPYWWPSGDFIELAMLRVSVEELSKRLGFRPDSGVEEGMGRYTGAAVRLPSGRVLTLTEYEYTPEPRGYRVNVAGDRDETLGAARDEVLADLARGLELKQTEISWTQSASIWESPPGSDSVGDST